VQKLDLTRKYQEINYSIGQTIMKYIVCTFLIHIKMYVIKKTNEQNYKLLSIIIRIERLPTKKLNRNLKL